MLKPKYCQLISQINIWLVWAKVLSINLSVKYLIANTFLIRDKYLIYDTKVLSNDLSDKHLIGLNQSIVSWSFIERHDSQQILYLRHILYWQHTLLKKLKYWVNLALVNFHYFDFVKFLIYCFNSYTWDLELWVSTV